MAELWKRAREKYGDVLDIEDVDAIMEAVDDDDDGLIDITEFYDSMESLDDHEEAGHRSRSREGVPRLSGKSG